MQSLSLQALFYKYEKNTFGHFLFYRKAYFNIHSFLPLKKSFIIWILQACPLYVMLHFLK